MEEQRVKAGYISTDCIIRGGRRLWGGGERGEVRGMVEVVRAKGSQEGSQVRLYFTRPTHECTGSGSERDWARELGKRQSKKADQDRQG